MPKERIQITAAEAHKEARTKIIYALEESPEGITFTAWWKKAQVHKDTLATHIPTLRKERVCRFKPQVGSTAKKKSSRKLYFPTKATKKVKKRMMLLRAIKKGHGMMVDGGEGSESPDMYEDRVSKTTLAFATPATSMDVRRIKDIVHAQFMASRLRSFIKRGKVDPRYITGELPIRNLVSLLRDNEFFSIDTQVIAYLIDMRKLKHLVSVEYLEHILRDMRKSTVNE